MFPDRCIAVPTSVGGGAGQGGSDGQPPTNLIVAPALMPPLSAPHADDPEALFDGIFDEDDEPADAGPPAPVKAAAGIADAQPVRDSRPVAERVSRRTCRGARAMLGALQRP